MKPEKPIYAIDIELPVTTKSTSVTYIGLTEDQYNYLLGVQQKNRILGFEWKGTGDIGIIIGDK